MGRKINFNRFAGGASKRAVALFLIILASTTVTILIARAIGAEISLPSTPQWEVKRGSWSSSGCLKVFSPQKASASGLLISPEKITKGSIDTTIIFPSYKSGCKAQVAYAFRSEYKSFLTAGLGGAGAAYSMGEYNASAGWKPLYKHGEEAILSGAKIYKLKLTLLTGVAVLKVNNVKVGEFAIEKDVISSPMGIWVEGCEETEFIDAKVCKN
jgi:hypothetical protein